METDSTQSVPEVQPIQTDKESKSQSLSPLSAASWMLTVLIGLLAGTALVLGVLTYVEIMTNPKAKQSVLEYLGLIKEEPTAAKLRTISPTPSPTPTSALLVAWKVMEVTEFTPRELHRLNCDKCIALLHNNELIYADEGTGQDTKTVWGYSLTTGAIRSIFQFQNQGMRNAPITQLVVLDGWLYVVFSEYMGGGVYALDLSEDIPKPVLIESKASPTLYEVDEAVYLVSGVGDACLSFLEIQLYESATRSFRRLVDSKRGCMEGEELVGMTSDYLYMATHTAGDPGNELPMYTQLSRRKVANPDEVEVLLSSDNMPKEITEVVFENNRFVLGGDQGWYSYDQETRALEASDISYTKEEVIKKNTLFTAFPNNSGVIPGDVALPQGFEWATR